MLWKITLCCCGKEEDHSLRLFSLFEFRMSGMNATHLVSFFLIIRWRNTLLVCHASSYSLNKSVFFIISFKGDDISLQRWTTQRETRRNHGFFMRNLYKSDETQRALLPIGMSVCFTWYSKQGNYISWSYIVYTVFIRKFKDYGGGVMG